jgi:hypothetical protein
MSSSVRSRRRHVAIPATLLFVAGLTAACSGVATTASPPGPPSGPPASGPTPVPVRSPGASPGGVAGSAPILVVTSEGGFINPVVTLGALPQLVVDTDGRLFTPATDAALEGGDPLIPAVDVRDLGPDAAAAIVEAIQAAGLDREHQNDALAADLGVTVFTVDIGGVETVNSFAAGAVRDGPGIPGLPGVPGANGPEDRTPDPAAVAAFTLLSKLLDPSVAWGGADAPPVRFQPAAYRVYAAPDAAPSQQGSAGPAPAWPLATGLDSFGVAAVPDLGLVGLRSGVVQGADAATLAGALGSVAVGTPVTSGGRLWQVWIRPLLPEEVTG